jgi:hypothetical protein
MFESLRDRRRRCGKIEKNAGVSQIHLRRDVQPEERIVRLDRRELSESMLGRDGYAVRILQQLTARKLCLQQQRFGIDPIPVQVVQGLTGGDAARPQKRTMRDLALGRTPPDAFIKKLA